MATRKWEKFLDSGEVWASIVSERGGIVTGIRNDRERSIAFAPELIGRGEALFIEFREPRFS